MDDYFCLLCHRASHFEVALISIKNRSKNFAGTLKKAFPRGFYALAFALVYFIVPAKIASMIVWQTLKRLCIAGTKISALSWLSSSLILSEKLRFPPKFFRRCAVHKIIEIDRNAHDYKAVEHAKFCRDIGNGAVFHFGRFVGVRTLVVRGIFFAKL